MRYDYHVTKFLYYRHAIGSALAYAVLAFFVPNAQAQNLVQNPGFEDSTGMFSSPGWVLGTGGGTNFTNNASEAHSGNWSVSFMATNTDVAASSALSQTIATTPNTAYVVSFWLKNLAGPTNSFMAQFDGQTVLTITNQQAFGYTLFTDVITTGPESTQSVLQFVGEQQPASFQLDDVSVQLEGAPAPVTGGGIASFAAALGLFAVRRMRLAKS